MSDTSMAAPPAGDGGNAGETVASAKAQTSETRHIVILSGISGAGKTTALKSFEDIGYEAIDNPPFALLLPLLAAPPAARIVVGVDARTLGLDVPRLIAAIADADATAGVSCSLVYLDCDEEVALRRFKETRRRHPLAADQSPAAGLKTEQKMLVDLRGRADHVLDTSIMAPRELKRWVAGAFSPETDTSMQVQVISFSFRQGLPREADMVFDVRFLANPHYEPDLKPLSGLDAEVGAYVEADPGAATFIDALDNLLRVTLPRHEQEGKVYLTIAIGCTGGRHRSVYLTEKVSGMLYRQGWPVTTIHRDIDREHQFQASR